MGTFTDRKQAIDSLYVLFRVGEPYLFLIQFSVNFFLASVFHYFTCRCRNVQVMKLHVPYIMKQMERTLILCEQRLATLAYATLQSSDFPNFHPFKTCRVLWVLKALMTKQS